MTAKYSHAFDIAFEVSSDEADGDDVTPDMMRAALMRRIEALDSRGDLGWYDAVDLFDTCETDPKLHDAVGILREKYIGVSLDRRKKLSQARREAEHEQQLYDEGRLNHE